MDKWVVGQRVRIVRPFHSQNEGLTGWISEIGPWFYMQKLPDGSLLGCDKTDCMIRLDSPRHDGSTYAPNSFDQIEPILPEGHKPSEFSFSELMDNLGVVVA